jgi:hypothetical protein
MGAPKLNRELMEKEGCIKKFAELFHDKEEITFLLKSAQIPLSRLKSFDAFPSSDVYWDYIGEQLLHKGLVTNGFVNLLRAASELYPGNEYFQRFLELYDPPPRIVKVQTLPEPPELPPPSQQLELPPPSQQPELPPPSREPVVLSLTIDWQAGDSFKLDGVPEETLISDLVKACVIAKQGPRKGSGPLGLPSVEVVVGSGTNQRLRYNRPLVDEEVPSGACLLVTYRGVLQELLSGCLRQHYRQLARPTIEGDAFRIDLPVHGFLSKETKDELVEWILAEALDRNRTADLLNLAAASAPDADALRPALAALAEYGWPHQVAPRAWNLLTRGQMRAIRQAWRQVTFGPGGLA